MITLIRTSLPVILPFGYIDRHRAICYVVKFIFVVSPYGYSEHEVISGNHALFIYCQIQIGTKLDFFYSSVGIPNKCYMSLRGFLRCAQLLRGKKPLNNVQFICLFYNMLPSEYRGFLIDNVLKVSHSA